MGNLAANILAEDPRAMLLLAWEESIGTMLIANA
jgi:hypothetical protein